MSAKSALDSIENILAILAKGDADPATKLDAVQTLLYNLRADVQELAAGIYSDYLPAPEDDFDMADAVAKLYEPLKKQEFQNLYAYYDDPERFSDLPTDNIRVAMAKALTQIAQDVEEQPNALWASIILAEGDMTEGNQ